MHTRVKLTPAARVAPIAAPLLRPLRASVRRLRVGVSCRFRLRAKVRRIAADALCCRESTARANAPFATALRHDGGSGDGDPLAAPPLPCGVAATSQKIAVEVAAQIVKDAQPPQTTAHTATYLLPVLRGTIVATTSAAVMDCSLPALPRRIFTEGEECMTRPLHFLDLTALSTQDNTLLRDKRTGELLSPCTLLVCPNASAGEMQRRGRPGAAAVLVKRRRIVVVDPEAVADLAKDGLQLVSFVLKKPTSAEAPAAAEG